ncbi:MAG: bifunctional 3-demethylubiquinone-9 3-methyltransferase/ 2-octaprenyl-6-hydroxy phenol methylase [bacterium ADurb.BinA186]|nr:MAG: bifunctional 3-demethylubiquinone-9 3-methyltransferase/ 2-octaprenyl-6-hydroxy phenol methylase [bacterium ADurb.BinA186]
MNQNKSEPHWENIYNLRSPKELSWFQNEPAMSLKLIKSISNNQTHIIDVGAGTSTLVDALVIDGYSNLAVLDISGTAIELVKRRLGEQANKIEWYKNDIRHFAPVYKYDVWHDRAVFHFLIDEESRKSYVTTLKKTVKKGGHLIIATFAKDGPKKCSGLDIVQYDSASIALMLGDGFKLLKTDLEMHLTPKGDKQLFNYFLFEANSDISSLQEPRELLWGGCK